MIIYVIIAFVAILIGMAISVSAFGTGGKRKKIFQDKRKTLHEIGAYTSLEILLNAFCGAALEQHGGRTPSFKNRRILDLLGNNAPDPDWPLHRFDSEFQDLCGSSHQ